MGEGRKKSHMERRCSDYPISKLLQATLAHSGLRGGEVAQKLGYRNAAGGFRAVDTWLETGTGNPDVLKRFVNGFGLSLEAVNEAIQKTNDVFEAEEARQKAEREERERDTFQPYILIEVSNRVPDGITILGVTGAFTSASSISVHGMRPSRKIHGAACGRRCGTTTQRTAGRSCFSARSRATDSFPIGIRAGIFLWMEPSLNTFRGILRFRLE